MGEDEVTEVMGEIVQDLMDCSEELVFLSWGTGKLLKVIEHAPNLS